jgi:hypothetical protein
MRQTGFTMLLLVLQTLTCGCSTAPQLVKVKGTIANSQNPIAVGKGGVTVVFIPMQKEGKASTSSPANYDNETGAFEVLGRDGRGIPPGKYRVSLMVMASPATDEAAAISGAFRADNSPITIDVKGEEPITIDLVEYLGKK